jgi:hypothetical protein
MVKYLKPIIDVKTRWKSTYDMLECMIGLRQPIVLLANDRAFADAQPTPQQWSILVELMTFLKVS